MAATTSGGMQIPPLVKGVVGLVILGGGSVAAYKWYGDYKTKKDLDTLAKLQKTSAVTGINANGKPASVNLTVIAADIYDAFHSNPFADDEARAIRALKSTPVLKIRQLSDVYQKVYKLNLQEEFRKYLSDEEFIGVKYFFK